MLLTLRLIGAALVIAGIVYMARGAIFRGRFSDPHDNPTDTANRTLEPRHATPGLATNWPGPVMVVAGALLILMPAFL
jgi:hypothetical protein